MPRVLKRKTKIYFENVEEEQEILEMDLPLETKETVYTLGWLADINEDKAKEILQGYSARDLATAWIGPDYVLDKLMGYMPVRKQDLLKSYLETTEPNRQSPVFQGLHEAAIEVMKNQTEEEVGEHEEYEDYEDKAA